MMNKLLLQGKRLSIAQLSSFFPTPLLQPETETPATTPGVPKVAPPRSPLLFPIACTPTAVFSDWAPANTRPPANILSALPRLPTINGPAAAARPPAGTIAPAAGPRHPVSVFGL